MPVLAKKSTPKMQKKQPENQRNIEYENVS